VISTSSSVPSGSVSWQAIVPKARPTSQVTVVTLRTSRSISSGRAEVVKSRSEESRPSNASRTEPPTR